MSEPELSPIPNYPGYLIARNGEMFSRRRGPLRKLTPYCESGGPSVCTVFGNIRVQAALLLTFVGPRPAGHEASFVDGDQTNLSLSNLAWRTRREIIAGAIDRGTLHKTPPGTPSRSRRLSDHQVTDIRARIASGEKQSDLAREYQVSEPVVSWIKQKKTYQRTSAQGQNTESATDKTSCQNIRVQKEPTPHPGDLQNFEPRTPVDRQQLSFNAVEFFGLPDGSALAGNGVGGSGSRIRRCDAGNT